MADNFWMRQMYVSRAVNELTHEGGSNLMTLMARATRT